MSPSHSRIAEPQADVDVPALLVKIGNYPLHHGGVGIIRSLGRLGIPVYAITEDRWTPAAMSRFLCGRFVWPTTGEEEPAGLIKGLLDIGGRIGRPAVLVPTDDEAAVLIAEHAATLADVFLVPDVEPSLPRRLANKGQLYDMCLEHGVPSPLSALAHNVGEVESFVSRAHFPIVVKNAEPFERLRAPIVGGTTVIEDAATLRTSVATWGRQFSVLLQEYLPLEDAEDWIFHAYCDQSSDCLVQFTGVKVRSYPPHTGVTTCAYSVHNPILKDLAARFVKQIGFRGVLDLDWRYDRRTGSYNLLDFNPRVGAQFRMFENEAGIDVVRALHLDMTGREVMPAMQIERRRYLVESFDPVSLLAHRRGYSTPSAPVRADTTELAWFAVDDVAPVLVMLIRLIPVALRWIRGGLQRLQRHVG